MRTRSTGNTSTHGRPARVSLILIFMLSLSAVVLSGVTGGLQEAQAATYQVIPNNTTNVGADGTTDLISGATTSTAPRKTMMGTLTSTASSFRPTLASAVTTTLISAYTSTVYAANTTISGVSANFAVRHANTGDLWTFHLYDYNPAGAAGNGTLIAQSSTITGTTAGTTYAVNPTYTIQNGGVVQANHRIKLVIVITPGGATLTPRVYYDGAAATSQSYVTYTETPVAGDQVNVADGTDIADATVSKGSTTAADGFTMAMNANTGSVTGVTVSLTNSANVTGIRLYRDAGTIGSYDGSETLLSTGTVGATVNFTGFTENLTTTATNYLIVVDISSGATGGQTVQASVTGITVTSPDSQGTVTDTGRILTISSAVVLPNTITSCAGCHGYTTSFTDGSLRNTPPGAFPGSHGAHVVTYSKTCSICHTTPATETSSDFNHRNGYINMANPTINGGTYSKATSPTYSFQQTNTVSMGSCNNVTCHSTVQGANGTGAGTSMPQTWGNTGLTCSSCHVDQSSASGTGRHVKHANNAVGNYNMACSTCHTGYTSTSDNVSLHTNSVIDVALPTGTYSGGTTSGNHAPQGGYGTCSNVYCHSTAQSQTGGSPATYMTPTWGGSGSLGCGGCHADMSSSPTASRTGSHLAHVTSQGYACNNCHTGYTSTSVDTTIHTNGSITVNSGLSYTGTATPGDGYGGCTTAGCHGTATWGGAPLSCVNCHNSILSAPTASTVSGGTVTQRRDVVTEFTQASSHKRSAGGAVTQYDCIVCHMEGNMATGGTTTQHKNGYVDLRDPDTGVQIQLVSWSGTTAGSYTSTGATASFTRFSRNLSSNVLESGATAIMINQCLKCHDSNGAAGGVVVPSGTAMRPFNTIISHTSGSNVFDIKSHFTTTNRSYHPILGKQNNSYASNTRMVAPWNMTKTKGNTTSWGYLITCWDCHATQADSGTITKTVTAHGAALSTTVTSSNVVELRGSVWFNKALSATNATTLCVKCHAGYDTSTTTNHSTGSAFSNSGSSSMSLFLRYGCTYCHSSNPNPNSATRSGRSADVHGYNTTYQGAAYATANGYGFIRNTSTGGNGSGLQLTPASVGGVAQTTACFGTVGATNLTNGTTSCGVNNMGNSEPFSVGGTY